MTSDRHWPRGLLVFFLLFVGSIVVFSAWSVLRNPVDLVMQDYYADEVRYQAQIDRKQRTAALAERPVIRHDDGARQIVIEFPTAPSGGEVHLYRPSASALDQRHALQLDAERRQRIATSHFEPGLWKLRLTWTQAGLEYYLEESLVLDATPPR